MNKPNIKNIKRAYELIERAHNEILKSFNAKLDTDCDDECAQKILQSLDFVESDLTGFIIDHDEQIINEQKDRDEQRARESYRAMNKGEK